MKYVVEFNRPDITMVADNMTVEAASIAEAEKMVAKLIAEEWRRNAKSFDTSKTSWITRVTVFAEGVRFDPVAEMAKPVASVPVTHVPPPKPLPEPTINRWKAYDRLSCLGEGWNIFCDNYTISIVAEEGVGEFVNDAQAIDFVRTRAASGSEYHRVALELAGLE